MDSDVIAEYHAVEVTPRNRSGVMADVAFEGALFRVVSGACTHPDIEIALYLNGRESKEDLSAIVFCPVCGYRETIAAQLLTPAQQVTRNSSTAAIFGRAEARFQGRVPAWGRTAKHKPR